MTSIEDPAPPAHANGPGTRPSGGPATARLTVAGDLAATAAGAGLCRIEILAWRDLEHPEAGGSEVHAAR
ncbi:MAG: hypothetical protein ACRDYY_06225, partial [Acidimicrobiales bacterium]